RVLRNEAPLPGRVRIVPAQTQAIGGVESEAEIELGRQWDDHVQVGNEELLRVIDRTVLPDARVRVGAGEIARRPAENGEPSLSREVLLPGNAGRVVEDRRR